MSRPDRDQLWRQLELTKTQVAKLTGLSRRQIVYWSSKGLIGSPTRRTFDGPAVEKVMVMKEALQRGARLEDAARQADRQLGRSR